MSATLVEDAEGLRALCTRIERVERVAFDTEFHNEKSYAARLMVLQLAVGDELVIVDALRVGDLMPLAEAFTTKTVVGHALQSDLKIFADRFDRLPEAALDTQLAAAFCGYGMAISLADLVNDLTGVRLRKSQTVSDWSARPFTPQQIEYLVDDVRHLIPMADVLRARLEESGRWPWFEEDARSLVDPARYRPDPERLYLRIPGAMRMNRRELGVLREIARLRDSLARERDVPLKYIIPDDVMSGLVALRPSTRDELSQLRRLDAGARKHFGDRIVAAVAAGLALEDADLPRRPARPTGADRDAVVACLSVLVNAIATDNDLPAALLAPRAALERIARELPPTADAISQTIDAGGWRAALVAEPLHALLTGRVALTITGGASGNPRVERVENVEHS